jgi:hypothetical protein
MPSLYISHAKYQDISYTKYLELAAPTEQAPHVSAVARVDCDILIASPQRHITATQKTLDRQRSNRNSSCPGAGVLRRGSGGAAGVS